MGFRMENNSMLRRNGYVTSRNLSPRLVPVETLNRSVERAANTPPLKSVSSARASSSSASCFRSLSIRLIA